MLGWPAAPAYRAGISDQLSILFGSTGRKGHPRHRLPKLWAITFIWTVACMGRGVAPMSALEINYDY